MALITVLAGVSSLVLRPAVLPRGSAPQMASPRDALNDALDVYENTLMADVDRRVFLGSAFGALLGVGLTKGVGLPAYPFKSETVEVPSVAMQTNEDTPLVKAEVVPASTMPVEVQAPTSTMPVEVKAAETEAKAVVAKADLLVAESATKTEVAAAREADKAAKEAKVAARAAQKAVAENARLQAEVTSELDGAKSKGEHTWPWSSQASSAAAAPAFKMPTIKLPNVQMPSFKPDFSKFQLPVTGIAAAIGGAGLVSLWLDSPSTSSTGPSAVDILEEKSADARKRAEEELAKRLADAQVDLQMHRQMQQARQERIEFFNAVGA